MNADELRALQAPLKDQYRQTPQAASITLKAQGRLGAGVSCSVDTGRALVQAGLHPATGGDGLAACSGDMLLQVCGLPDPGPAAAAGGDAADRRRASQPGRVSLRSVHVAAAQAGRQ